LRLIPARRLTNQPAKVKNTVSEIKRVEPPVKGLALLGKATQTDPQTATILTNWSIRENRLEIRPGTLLVRDEYPTGPRHAIERLLPWLAQPEVMLASTNKSIIKVADGTVYGSGFGSDDWQGVMFSDLSKTKRLVMVNGADGVWSYDGGNALAPGVVTVTRVDPAAATQVTVAAADIGKFAVGRTVSIAGVTASGMTAANGLHVITAVGSPVNTFNIDANTTGGTAQTTGSMTATPYGSLQKEPITAPANSPWCNPSNFHVVDHHLNRLYFADPYALVVYYLPLQQKSGQLAALPLDPVFKKGGHIQAIASWTVDGGLGLDDKLVVFSSNGEIAIFTGVDPTDDAWSLVGIFQHDSPMSKHCVGNYGGDLWSLTSTGLAPMTTLIRAETEKLDKAEKGVISFFREISARVPNLPGWQLVLDHSSGRMICNMPLGSAGDYQQMVRFMPDPVWAKWRDLKSRCWAWMADRIYVGTDDGKVYDVNDDYTSDDGIGILAECRTAWSNYKTPGIKQFKMVRVYGRTTGLPTRPFIDIAVNFLDNAPGNQPEVLVPPPATLWGPAGVNGPDNPPYSPTPPWGTPWGRGWLPMVSWGGVGRLGNVGAPVVKVSVKGSRFELSGFDVVFEAGIIV